MCKCPKSCKRVYYSCASLLIKSVSSLKSGAPLGWYDPLQKENLAASLL